MPTYYFSHLSDHFTFGAYRGLTLSDVIDSCPNYIRWCIFTISGFCLQDEAMEEIHKIYPNLFRSSEFENQRKANLAFEEEESADDAEYDSQDYERPTYDNYHGSYAQDEMGYSDDDIDTIFDGDPDAYWNID